MSHLTTEGPIGMSYKYSALWPSWVLDEGPPSELTVQPEGCLADATPQDCRTSNVGPGTEDISSCTTYSVGEASVGPQRLRQAYSATLTQLRLILQLIIGLV